MLDYINMNDFTKRELAFVKKLKNDNADLSKLTKQLIFLIKYCQIVAAIIIPFILFVFFVIGEKPKIYHILIFSSVFFILLAKYLNWKHALKVIGKLRKIDGKED